MRNPPHSPSRRARRARRAATLVELLLSLALSGIVLAAAGTVLLQSLKNDISYRRQMNARQAARTAADTIADDLKGALRFTSLVTVGSTQQAQPTNSVTGTLAVGATGSIDSHTSPATWDILSDSVGMRRVRYWRTYNSTLQTNELRREIVNDGLDANGARTATTAATAATAGTVVARGVSRFAIIKQSLGGSATNDIACVIVEVTDGNAVATVQANVSLRNNAVSNL